MSMIPMWEIIGAIVSLTGANSSFNLAKTITEESIKVRRENASTLEESELPAEIEQIDPKLLQAYARAVQEINIAWRIKNSSTVELEEYYEGSGKGQAGLQSADGSMSIGMSGQGNRVTKRIYKFTGIQDQEGIVEQDLPDQEC